MSKRCRSRALQDYDEPESEEEARYARRQEDAEKYGEMTGECPGAEDLTCPNLMFVNAYLVDQAYGGAEEGGWYYDVRQPLASVPVAAKPEQQRPHGEWRLVPVDLAEVERLRARLKEQFACLQDERGRYSVVGGPDVEVYLEECPAKASPTTRPRYE
jgi:hypothetical protein